MNSKQQHFREARAQGSWMHSPTKRGRSRLAMEVESYEREVEQQRQRYENAIVTLHAKVASLQTTLDLEESRGRRQQELIQTLELEVRSSKLADSLKKEERSKVDLKLNDEIQTLRDANLALKFQLALAKDKLSVSESQSSENRDPNSSIESDMNLNLAGMQLSKTVPKLSDFSRALREGNEAVVRSLIQGPSPEVLRHSLCEFLDKSLLSAIQSQRSNMVYLLLDNGASMNAVDHATGKAAIHLVCEYGLDQVLEHSLVKDVSSQGELDLPCSLRGQTPLHLAAKGHHMKCCTLLLRYGANPDLVDKSNQTPLDLAQSSSSEISTSLEEDGSSKDETVASLTDPAILFWAHSVRANRLYGSENYKEALDAYNAAITLSERSETRVQTKPDSTTSIANKATLQYNSARAAVKLGYHVEAIKRCTVAIDIKDGDYPNAVAQRAASYLAIYDYAHAIADYDLLMKQAHKENKPAPEEWNSNLARAKDLQSRYKDHYFVLGVAPEATSTEIKKAFRKQCLKWHPDKHRASEDDTARASVMFKAINEANEVLQNEQKRTLFDIDRISRRMDDIVRRQQDNKETPGTSVTPAEVRAHYSYHDNHVAEQQNPFRYRYEADQTDILSASSLSDDDVGDYNLDATASIESDTSSDASYLNSESKLPHSRAYQPSSVQSTYQSSYYTPAS